MSLADVTAAPSIAALRGLARARLPRGVFDFFDGGAEDEVTLAANRSAFERLRLAPRVLVDVRQPQLATTVLGEPASAPLVVAPTGAVGAGWPGADIALAQAARRFGIPFTLSTAATSSIEDVARAVGGARLWFQLYVLSHAALTEKLLQRAEGNGFSTLVVTLDLPTAGKRERDLVNRFTMPLPLTPRTLVDFALHPHWTGQMCRQLLRHGKPRFGNLTELDDGGSAGPRAAIAAKVAGSLDAGFDRAALARLRERWRGRLVAKGVLRGDDAQALLALGVDAVWVSNHGGRQLDGCVAAADALPGVVRALAGRLPVLVDSGVRRGGDIFKALALGAQAAATGRATLYGVAAAGREGAERALEILVEELRRTMMLCGTPRITDIGADALALQADSPS